MKKNNSLIIASVLFLCTCAMNLQAQTTEYTWSSYKTKFKVPDTFKLEQNDSTKFSAGNNDFNLTIYPRRGENLDSSQMAKNLRTWAETNQVKNLGEITNLNTEKLNGYWGVFIEGDLEGFPVFEMLIVDPDYPEISLYLSLIHI